MPCHGYSCCALIKWGLAGTVTLAVIITVIWVTASRGQDSLKVEGESNSAELNKETSLLHLDLRGEGGGKVISHLPCYVTISALVTVMMVTMCYFTILPVFRKHQAKARDKKKEKNTLKLQILELQAKLQPQQPQPPFPLTAPQPFPAPQPQPVQPAQPSQTIYTEAQISPIPTNPISTSASWRN